ncbi:unnamed protein product [Angiostrongylus costaricensis]|uniref:Chromo domain-containing protein n=1 Tax=Angiostrongylus costaricensis TaxID=334426 RepID=A0A0R3PAF8_ANGCS|nr:unnamed protein product [Angiostrongylus costaricensis]
MRADGAYIYHIKWLGYETSSDPENFVEEKHMMCPDLIRDFEVHERRKKKKHLEELRRRMKQRQEEELRKTKLACSSSSSDEEDDNVCFTTLKSLLKNVIGFVVFRDRPRFVLRDDPYGGFKYISRESDGFKKGYKAVKVSLVTEHPTSGDVVGVVVFTHPHHGNQLAQYVPLREIHENAPMELFRYFSDAKGKDRKELALSLLLKKTTQM